MTKQNVNIQVIIQFLYANLRTQAHLSGAVLLVSPMRDWPTLIMMGHTKATRSRGNGLVWLFDMTRIPEHIQGALVALQAKYHAWVAHLQCKFQSALDDVKAEASRTNRGQCLGVVELELWTHGYSIDSESVFFGKTTPSQSMDRNTLAYRAIVQVRTQG